ncbi:MAG: hypothetical protein CL912_02310 [Deltaproteobacteria bacterium]|nr:hypothetical protein [Deltaproteobacteria bacterium]|tara:strand:+ start:379 stop:771 length:393 start_codon:yes stop_codon:yes gene_type:complete
MLLFLLCFVAAICLIAIANICTDSKALLRVSEKPDTEEEIKPAPKVSNLPPLLCWRCRKYSVMTGRSIDADEITEIQPNSSSARFPAIDIYPTTGISVEQDQPLDLESLKAWLLTQIPMTDRLQLENYRI